MSTYMFLRFEEPAGTQVCAGDCTDQNHSDWIEVLSWSHSFSQSTSAVRSAAGAGTVERANHSDWSFTKYVDKSTDDLLKQCWVGKHMAKGIFEAYRAEATPVLYLKIEFEDVVVSNFSISGGGGDLPIENISLSYGKVQYTYSHQEKTGKAAGQAPVYHDMRTNKVA